MNEIVAIFSLSTPDDGVIEMVARSRILFIVYYEFKGVYNAIFSNPIAYLIAIALGLFLVSWTFQGITIANFAVKTFLPGGYDPALVTPLIAHVLTLILLQRLITGVTKKGVLQQVSEADFDYLFPSPASYTDVYLALKLKDEFVSFVVFTVFFTPICAGFITGLGSGANIPLTVLATILVFWIFLLLTGLIKDLVFFFALDATNEIIQQTLRILKISRWLALGALLVVVIAVAGLLSGVVLVLEPLVQWLLILEMLLPSGLAALAIEGLLIGGTAVQASTAITAVLLVLTLCLLYLATRAANRHYFEQLLLEKPTAVQGTGQFGHKIQRTFFSPNLTKGSAFIMIVKKDILMVQRVYRRVLVQVYLLPVMFTFLFVLFTGVEEGGIVNEPLFFRAVLAYAMLFMPAVPLVLIGLESTSFYTLKSSDFYGIDFVLGKFTVSILIMVPPVLLLSSILAVLVDDWYLVTTALAAAAVLCAVYTMAGCWKPPWNPRTEMPTNIVTSVIAVVLVMAALAPLLLLSSMNPSGMVVYALLVITVVLLLAERFYSRLLEFT